MFLWLMFHFHIFWRIFYCVHKLFWMAEQTSLLLVVVVSVLLFSIHKLLFYLIVVTEIKIVWFILSFHFYTCMSFWSERAFRYILIESVFAQFFVVTVVTDWKSKICVVPWCREVFNISRLFSICMMDIVRFCLWPVGNMQFFAQLLFHD